MSWDEDGGFEEDVPGGGFDYLDERGDPEDEADAQDEHNGVWGGLWQRFAR